MKKKIGIFDSGYGGLTVLAEIRKILPQYSYVYLGDNRRAPYGDLATKKIYEHTYEATKFLFERNCSLVVVACNTVSSRALRRLQHKHIPNEGQIRVLGILVPVVEKIRMLADRGSLRLALLATRATIRSGAYQAQIKQIGHNIKLFSRSCPDLVPLIENGDLRCGRLSAAVESYTKPLINKDIDFVLLGCTHFHYLETNIKKRLPCKARIIKTPKVVALSLKKYLDKHQDMKARLERKQSLQVFTSGDAKRFEEFYRKNFKKNIKVRQARLS